MIQREGRILRQGNQNPRVFIYRYITEGSFDAYSWQLLETKQRFISDLLAGSISERSGEDVANTVLNYAEVKALAVGNPLVKQRVETANELARLISLQRNEKESRIALEKELLDLPGKISHQTEVVRKCKADLALVSRCRQNYDKDEKHLIRQRIYEAVKANEMMPEERNLMNYRGFNIILPANMTAEKPYIWLEQNGRYYLELSDNEYGIFVRIENFIDKFNELLQKLKDGLSSLYVRQNEIQKELNTRVDYSSKICSLRDRLEKIDKKLGVKGK